MAQGRRVRRVVRKFDAWSVLKVSFLFYTSLLLIVLLAGVMLWLAGGSVGAIDSVERFMRGIGFSGFRFVSDRLLQGFAAAGVTLVVLATVMTVLMAVIYNLISDVVGGIQVIVLEEAAPAPVPTAPPVEASEAAAQPPPPPPPPPAQQLPSEHRQPAPVEPTRAG